MTERKRSEQQTRHDLVANAEQHGSVVKIMRQRDSRRHCDDIAGEQRKFHPRLALRHAVAHGGDASGKLRHSSVSPDFVLDDGRIVSQRLVRREHVVVGRNDPDHWYRFADHPQLVAARKRGVAMRQVGRAQAPPGKTLCAVGPLHGEGAEVQTATRLASAGDGSGDAGHDGMDGGEFC